MLTISARKLMALLGGDKGTPTEHAVCEWLVEAARHFRRTWFPWKSMPAGTVQDFLDITDALPHPLAVKTELKALFLGYLSQK